MRRAPIWIALVVLLAGTVASLRPERGHVTFSAAHPLDLLAPSPPPGWQVENTPLGPTEMEADGAAQALNFDDYFYKTYRKENLQVRFYSAYWTPGRMDPSMVSRHVPDACWVSDGGTILALDNHRILPGIADPARFRIFEFPHLREEVVYWYCQGGETIVPPDESAAPIGGRLRSFAQMLQRSHFGIRPQEQLLIRISTNGSIDELVKSDLWPVLVGAIRSGGAFPDASARR